MPGVLALLAHPDDEFFCGGLLASAAACGVPVHLVYWTRGEGGGSPRARFAQSFLPRTWHPRVREARRVAKLLSASLDFLGAVDPAPEPPRAPDETGTVEAIARLIAKYEPEIVVTHGSDGDYGHPAHLRLHEIVRTLDFPASLLSFNAIWEEAPTVRFLNANDMADFVFDVSAWREQKRAVVLAHRSQRGALENLADGTLEDLLDATACEGYRCWSGREMAEAFLRRLAV
jgi:LmbE family N-acetylglucosaminyl deacetylase